MRVCRDWSTRFASCRSEAAAGRRGDAGPGRFRRLRVAARGVRRGIGSAAARAFGPPVSRPSGPSAPGCIDWRPSRLLAAALALIGLLAACAVVASELPPRLSWPAAALAAGWGAALARREKRRPPRRLRLAGNRAWLDDAPIAQVRLHWRGPLARLEFRGADGRRGRLLWWPDTLGAHGRRELRLAAAVAIDTPTPRSVAP